MTEELEALLASPMDQHEEFRAAIRDELLVRQAAVEVAELRRGQAAERRTEGAMRVERERQGRDAAIAADAKREREYLRRFPRRIAD